MNPNEEVSGRCSAIGSLLNSMGWTFAVSPWERPLDGEKIDTARARQCMKSIHLLFRHGAKWNADERDQISSACRALLKLNPDYTVEFVWLLSKFRACSRESVEALISTPSMRRHVSAQSDRIRDILMSWDAKNGPVPATV